MVHTHKHSYMSLCRSSVVRSRVFEIRSYLVTFIEVIQLPFISTTKWLVGFEDLYCEFFLSFTHLEKSTIYRGER